MLQEAAKHITLDMLRGIIVRSILLPYAPILTVWSRWFRDIDIDSWERIKRDLLLKLGRLCRIIAWDSLFLFGPFQLYIVLQIL